MRRALRVMAMLAAFGLAAWIGVVALAQNSSTPPTGAGDNDLVFGRRRRRGCRRPR